MVSMAMRAEDAPKMHENVGIILEGDLPVVYDVPQVVPTEFVDVF